MWQYLAVEQVELPSLYFAHERQVFERDGMLLADSEFLPRRPEEKLVTRSVRCRTIGDITTTACGNLPPPPWKRSLPRSVLPVRRSVAAGGR